MIFTDDRRYPCKDCGHGAKVHGMYVYRHPNGDAVRTPIDNQKPAYHLTAYGTCSCTKYNPIISRTSK